MQFVKLSITALIAALVIFAIAALPTRICFDGGCNYEFYCGTSSADCKIVRAQGSAKLERVFLTGVCGEGAEFKELDIGKFLSSVKGEIIFIESAAGITNYYCTADLPYSTVLDGRQINLHIAVREDSVKVGSPIIFGGY